MCVPLQTFSFDYTWVRTTICYRNWRNHTHFSIFWEQIASLLRMESSVENIKTHRALRRRVEAIFLACAWNFSMKTEYIITDSILELQLSCISLIHIFSDLNGSRTFEKIISYPTAIIIATFGRASLKKLNCPNLENER